MNYLYRHIRLDTNTPFYIGKATGNRAYSKQGRNRYWHNIVNLVGYRIEIIMFGRKQSDEARRAAQLARKVG